MNRSFIVASLSLAFGSISTSAVAQDVLTGDTRLACEAILCLSSGTRPTECLPSLNRYFSINLRKFSDTIRERANFLRLCPVSNQTPEMQSLVAAIVDGAGHCDPGSLNRTLVMWRLNRHGSYETYISDQMPEYCSAYVGHAYTDFKSSGTLPRYVGLPERGGSWVQESEYAQALAAYTERVRREDERRRYRYYGN
ncbi:hypothetical protein ABIC71_004527 [Herbaspirillum seropedicae]|uniref:TrbM/KikA/MpfK family conjugal transfer protein n=1 Tax=Herbaspirillum seropedicae TaxID=964 RepID=UPI003395D564